MRQKKDYQTKHENKNKINEQKQIKPRQAKQKQKQEKNTKLSQPQDDPAAVFP